MITSMHAKRKLITLFSPFVGNWGGVGLSRTVLYNLKNNLHCNFYQMVLRRYIIDSFNSKPFIIYAYLIILTPASDFAPNPTNQMCVLCRGSTKRYDFLACKITRIEKKLALTEFAANTHSVFSLKQLI